MSAAQQEHADYGETQSRKDHPSQPLLDRGRHVGLGRTGYPYQHYARNQRLATGRIQATDFPRGL